MARRTDDRGFTLVELMVVILIIAILMAIAIPSYFGTVRRTKDRAAQSNLRNAMVAARTIATEAGGLFLDADSNLPINADALQSAEGAIEVVVNFVDLGQADVRAISVRTADAPLPPGSQIVFVTKSETGRYYCIRIDDQGRTFFGRGRTEVALNGDFAACAGDDFTFAVV